MEFKEFCTLIDEKIAVMADDWNKVYRKKNKAAGVRLRKKLKEIKDLCDLVRKDTLNK